MPLMAGQAFNKAEHRVATVRAMAFLGQTCDRVVGIRAIDPLVAVHPNAQLKLQAARHGLFADEFQHFEIPLAFGVGQLRHPHVVTRHGQQERVGEKEIPVRDIAEKVVADPQRQIEAIEALRRQHGEIGGPHLAVVVPGLVFDLADKEPVQAAHDIGRLLDDRLCKVQRGQGLGSIAHPVRKIQAAHRQAPARRGRTPAIPFCRMS